MEGKGFQEILRSVYGSNHADIAKGLNNLERAVLIYSNALGSDHPDLLEFLVDYARVMRESNQIARADSLDLVMEAIASKKVMN